EPLRKLIDSARRLVVVLVPYLEHPLCEFHPAQFRDESFPARIGPAVRVAGRVVEVDPAYWRGRQFLAVYAHEECARELAGIPEAGPHSEWLVRLEAIEADGAAERA